MTRSFWAAIWAERDYSEDVASAIDQETRRMVDECFRRTEELLTKYLDKLHAVAEAYWKRDAGCR